MKLTAFGAALLLCSTAVAQAPAAPAPEAPKPPAFTFALHGFVSVSGAYQDGAFFLSDGQQSLAAGAPAAFAPTAPATTPPANAAGANPTADRNSLAFDVRQSRFNFSVKGPQVLFGATPTGVLEIDFFQGFGGGPNGEVSLLNRLRLAYSELNWGAHRLAFGQLNDLVFAFAPTSLSHIAFPLGYFTGNIGWRRPGFWGFHTFPVGGKDMKLEFAWEVGRSQWADASSGGAAGVTIGGSAPNQPFGIGQGEASSFPALEARLMLTHKIFSVFVASHYNQVDLNGVGNGGPNPVINVTALNAGAKVTLPLANGMGVSLAATGFTGKNVSPLIGQFIDFKLRGGYGGVNSTGVWAQAGFNLTKELSAWAFWGYQKPQASEALAAQLLRTQNRTTNIMAQYRDGGYGFSAEWIRFDTTTATYTAAPVVQTTKKIASNQYMLTANYFF